jgi:hypothetical protein
MNPTATDHIAGTMRESDDEAGLGSAGFAPGGGGAAWNATKTILDANKKLIAGMTFSDDCISAIHKISDSNGNALKASAVRAAVGGLNFSDPTNSRVPITFQWANGATEKTTVGGAFQSYNGLVALTIQGSSRVYWRPEWGTDAGTPVGVIQGAIMHEALHSVGLNDGQIEMGLFGHTDNNTDIITQELTKDCFK